jgi:hypothetical protein
MTTRSLEAALPRVVYCVVPVRIDGSSVTVDLTDDGEPGMWGNAYVYDGSPDGGTWEHDHGEDTFVAAWELVSSLLEREE